MALSLPISLTTVRDFFGSSSNNLTALHRGENNIINVASVYGSSTVGTGSITVNATGTANTGASYLTTTLPAVPHNLYPYGGVCPSLSSANSGIEDSGSIDLTDYVGAYRKVNPTASISSASSSGSHTGTYRGVSSPIDNPMAYKSFVGENYETLNVNPNISGFSVANYCQLLTVQSNQFDAFSTGSMTCAFTLSHAGIYTVYASVFGNGGSGQYFNLSGTGASLKTHAGVSVSGNITLPNYMPTAATARLFELTHTNTSSTLTLVCGGTGGATFVQIRTNTNYLRDVNTTNTTKYNDMMTQD
jgi:hypothetical protein